MVKMDIIGRSWGHLAGFCLYLRNLRPLYMSWGYFGRQILWLFMVFSPSLHVLGLAWETDFVVIYVILVLYMSWEHLGNHIVSLLVNPLPGVETDVILVY